MAGTSNTTRGRVGLALTRTTPPILASGEAREEIGLDPALRNADLSQDFLETDDKRARARKIKRPLAVIWNRFRDHLRINAPGLTLPVRRNTIRIRERVHSLDTQLFPSLLEYVRINDLRRGLV